MYPHRLSFLLSRAVAKVGSPHHCGSLLWLFTGGLREIEKKFHPSKL